MNHAGADNLATVSALAETVARLEAQYAQLEADEGPTVVDLRRQWLACDRSQFTSRSRHSPAALAFVCYLRALSALSPPATTGIDGAAMIETGIITAVSLTPAAYTQIELIDSVRAIRTHWLSACSCDGFAVFLDTLLHRTAILGCFTHPPDVLNDGTFSRVTADPAVMVASISFILDMEAFFRDAAVQLQWCEAALPVAPLAPEADVATVTATALDTLRHCIIAYANRPWFRLHWEFLLAPGERDAYHRARPCLNDDARSVLALFRGHELTSGVRCTEETLADTADTRSVLALCERAWGREAVHLTPSSTPRTGPSLRVACGELLLVDADDVIRGAPFQLVTLFLHRSGVSVQACAGAGRVAVEVQGGETHARFQIME
jgi:hypothetical protein